MPRSLHSPEKVTAGRLVSLVLLASLSPAAAAVSACLGAGAEVSTKGVGGLTPVHSAARLSGPAVVEVLLAAGADPEGPQDLTIAIVLGGPAVSPPAFGGSGGQDGALLAAGATVNSQDGEGSKPLHYAAEYHHPAVIEVPLATGAEANVRTKGGRTLAHAAPTYGHAANIEGRIEAGIDVNARDEHGATPLHAMARSRRGGLLRCRRCGHMLHRLEETIADCTEAIRLDPDSPRLYLERARAHSKLDRYEEAVADYDRAIGLDSDSAAAYLGRCHTNSELRRHEEGIEDYDHAVHLDPDLASEDA